MQGELRRGAMAPGLVGGLRALFGGSASGGSVPGSGREVPSAKARPVRPTRGVCQPLASAWPACHARPVADCAQCRFRAFGAKWTKTYGTVRHRRSEAEMLTIPWLRERVPAPGATWGVGCAVCASLRWRLQRRSGVSLDAAACPLTLGGLRVDTRWSRHEVSGIRQMQAFAFEQHSQTTLHKVAMHLYLRPEPPLDRVVGNEELAAATSLQQGAVPPPEHWLRVWRFVKSPTSFRAAAAILGTEAFLAHLRTGEERQETERRAISKAVECMAAVLRARARAALEAARSITLAVDDRGPYRVISYVFLLVICFCFLILLCF